MGAGAFHGRVRDGIGCGNPAMATRSSGPGRACDPGMDAVLVRVVCVLRVMWPSWPRGSSEARDGGVDDFSAWWRSRACRAIRTGQLHALPRFHTRPIDVMVYHGPRGDLVLRWVSRLDAFSGYPVRT